MLQALLNERMAPEILQYKEELVERVKSALQRQVIMRRSAATSLQQSAEAETLAAA